MNSRNYIRHALSNKLDTEFSNKINKFLQKENPLYEFHLSVFNTLFQVAHETGFVIKTQLKTNDTH